MSRPVSWVVSVGSNPVACVVGRGGAGGNGATVGVGGAGGVAVVIVADGVVLLDVDDGVSSITVSFFVHAGKNNALAIATHAITVLVIDPLSGVQGPTWVERTTHAIVAMGGAAYLGSA